jgi:hypothetical protein
VQDSNRPYLDAWLRRTRRLLAKSGRLSELAIILSKQEGGDRFKWEQDLRAILFDDANPSLDLVTAIDAILATPSQQSGGDQSPSLI